MPYLWCNKNEFSGVLVNQIPGKEEVRKTSDL
jgi:hypothetical protein